MVTGYITTGISLLFSIILMESWAYDVIVVDSATHFLSERVSELPEVVVESSLGALFLLKQVTGITLYKSHKNFNNRWNRFKKEQIRRNKQSVVE